MPNTESENSDSDEYKVVKDKFRMKRMSEISEMDKSQIIQYVDQLHKELKMKKSVLEKKNDQMKKLFEEIKNLKKKQLPAKLDTLDTNKHTPSINEKVSVENSSPAPVISLVDEIRQAAEQAQNSSGFVYEPTSGLFYDQKTGYYYNAEYGLYYDGNTGCYYNYDQEKNAFEFHSQVEVQPNQAASNDTNDRIDDVDKGGSAKYDDDVQFDEQGGVITDKEKLRALRKEKRKKQKELERSKKRKKKSSKKSKSRKESKSKEKRKKDHRRRSRSSDDDMDSADNKDEKKAKKCEIEDGELTDSSTSSSESNINDDSSDDENHAAEENGVPIFNAAGRFQDIAKKYPPSLRIIVQETNTESLKVGSLSLITYKGGTLGREGNHDVLIPDVNVSKCHLEFSYDRKKCVYRCIDLGSQNGTILNGERMSQPKVVSPPYDIVHGSVIQIGQTKLLCHSHEGNSTCGLCEPGLLIDAQTEKEPIVIPTVHLTRKEQLKKLQKKYGLENDKFVENKQPVTEKTYKDRAATRRITVGSSTDKQKTKTASVSTAISSENKGFKMLSKLGWTEGEALGKSQIDSGLLEPINVLSNDGKKGLGCEEVTLPELSKAEKKKIASARKMLERYQKSSVTFSMNEDSS